VGAGLRITRASVYLVEWPFNLPVEHSLARNEVTQNLVVKLTDQEGRSGFGEGIPRQYVTGETVEAALKALRERLLPALLGREILPDEALGFLERALAGSDLGDCPAAACAAEMALADLAGRVSSLPLSAMLGPALPQPRLIYSGVIPMTGPAQLERLLAQVKALELNQLKLKVGRQGDLKFVSQVREALGPRTRLRLDANGAWTPEEAVARIEAFARLGVEAVEQPVPKDDLAGLAHVTRNVETLILADESVCTPDQTRRLIEMKAVGGFNLRLSKCGGLARTLEMLNLARRAGLVCQLGCHVGELGLLTAAGRHFAQVQPDLIYLEGSLTRFTLGRDIIAEDLTFGRQGRASALPGPGLGVLVVEDSLADSHLLSLA